jgi:glucitol operon activator protein
MDGTAVLILFAALSLTALGSIAQHKYYVRTVRRLAREHDKPGCVLVSGRAKSRLRGAIAVLVLRRDDNVIEGAAVMEGASVMARFKDRTDWIGLPASGTLPRCSTRLASAVAEARSHAPGQMRTGIG